MQAKVDSMKKEYICYYFDKFFKGKVNENLFNNAKNKLFMMLIYSDNDIVLNFTKIYYEMHKDLEKEIWSVEFMCNDEAYFNSLNFLQKMSLKRKLKNVRKAYANFGKFNDLFFDAFGTSLVQIKDSIDREEKQQTIEQNSNMAEV